MTSRGNRRQQRGAEEKVSGIECSKKEKVKQLLVFDPWGFTQFRKAIIIRAKGRQAISMPTLKHRLSG